jgi:Holliday junction resolvase RusA-like endonuclease
MAENYTRIEIKPLSVNECWQGKRFKTPKYKAYETELLWMLPKLPLITTPIELEIIVGISKNADIDNIAKPFIDVLQKIENTEFEVLILPCE